MFQVSLVPTMPGQFIINMGGGLHRGVILVRYISTGVSCKTYTLGGGYTTATSVYCGIDLVYIPPSSPISAVTENMYVPREDSFK